MPRLPMRALLGHLYAVRLDEAVPVPFLTGLIAFLLGKVVDRSGALSETIVENGVADSFLKGFLPLVSAREGAVRLNHIWYTRRQHAQEGRVGMKRIKTLKND